jgi:hypothetical protein
MYLVALKTCKSSTACLPCYIFNFARVSMPSARVRLSKRKRLLGIQTICLTPGPKKFILPSHAPGAHVIPCRPLSTHRIVLALHSGIRLAHPLPALPHRASNCTILNKQVSTHSHRHPTLPQSHPNRARRCNSPVRPLLVQHAMSTVPAANGFAALERDVLVAVAAFVVYGASVGVDDGGVGRAGLCRVVLLGGHGCAFGSYGYE